METKPLALMKATERGALLADLFPEEIDSLINFIDGMCLTMLEEKAHAISLAKKMDIPYGRWIRAVKKSKKMIDTYRPKQELRFLMILLMGGDDLEYFNMYCANLMVTTRSSESHSEQCFHHAIHMLFD
ncbi:hypothetical protein [Pedobacter chitinilyticus]|uniref:Uncharacterized protein n=1 Tax=Pedobacter chitinilyticus TaxID=2233776 RepID=A0A3S3PZG1_9SPHI|nr:hypothetical protein [Pedobacter chitinilyticus]RWU08181.1 hypothetical protein DPV69_07305 [Pedobacter chitinilyticus]